MKLSNAHIRRAEAKHVDREFVHGVDSRQLKSRKKQRDVNNLLDRRLSLPYFKRVGSSTTLHSSSRESASRCSENKACDDVVTREVSSGVGENAKQKFLSSKIELIDCSDGCKSRGRKNIEAKAKVEVRAKIHRAMVSRGHNLIHEERRYGRYFLVC